MSVTKYFLGIKNIKNNKICNVDLSSELKLTIPTKNTFIADPFFFKYNGEYYVFFEIWDYHKGKIAYSKLDKYNNLTDIKICLETPYHLSFPCIFTYQEKIYMIPETTSQRCIKIFECEEFPSKWKFKTNLINNICAPDVSFFEHNNLVYLMTNTTDFLNIFVANNLFGKFKKHPINEKNIRRIAARNAGKIFIKNNILYRPGQICHPSYGYGVALYKINKISETEYEEEIVNKYMPNWFPELTGCHTFNICDDLLVIDGRLRIKSPNMTPVNSVNGRVYKSTDNDVYVNNYINNLLLQKLYKANSTVYIQNSRKYLVNKYFPNISGTCLFVGIGEYTQSYEFINKKLKYITIDINKDRAKYGSSQGHYICDFNDFRSDNNKINHINLFGVLGHPPISEKGIKYTLDNDLRVCLKKCAQLLDINGTVLLGPNYISIKKFNLDYWLKLFNNIIENFNIPNYSIIIADGNIMLWFQVSNYFLENA